MNKIAFRFPATVLVFLIFLWTKAINSASSGITDVDFYWHLTYGQWILEHMAIPTVDFFSWTFGGQPYQLTQWLGETLMGFAYNLWGLYGLKVLSVLLVGIIVGFGWAGAKRFVHTSAALCLALMCNLIHIFLPMRPQLFSFALLSVATYLVISYIETRMARFLAVYPLLMALWVNLHGGFVVGLGLIGLAAIGVSFEAYSAGRLKASIQDLFPIWGCVAASAFATLLNPYGIHAILPVIEHGNMLITSVIAEWKPVNLFTEIGWLYLMILVPYVAFMLVSGSRPRFTYGLIAGLFFVFGLMANRQMPMCAAVMPPLAAALLARTEQYRTMLPNLINPSRPKTFTLICAILAVSFLSVAASSDAKKEDQINFRFPVEAVDFLETHQLTNRVLSDSTREASYMIHRGIPVFIDGRMDLYRDKFVFDWYFASRATPGWEKIIEKHQPGAMLLRHDMAIRQAALASGRWKQVFEDDRYSILVRAEHPLPEIAAREVSYFNEDRGLIRPYTP